MSVSPFRPLLGTSLFLMVKSEPLILNFDESEFPMCQSPFLQFFVELPSFLPVDFPGQVAWRLSSSRLVQGTSCPRSQTWRPGKVAICGALPFPMHTENWIELVMPAIQFWWSSPIFTIIKYLEGHQIYIWLVVWNMNFIFHNIWDVILPID